MMRAKDVGASWRLLYIRQRPGQVSGSAIVRHPDIIVCTDL